MILCRLASHARYEPAVATLPMVRSRVIRALTKEGAGLKVTGAVAAAWPRAERAVEARSVSIVSRPPREGSKPNSLPLTTERLPPSVRGDAVNPPLNSAPKIPLRRPAGREAELESDLQRLR